MSEPTHDDPDQPSATADTADTALASPGSPGSPGPRPPRTIFSRIEQTAAVAVALVVLAMSVRYLADLPRGPIEVQHNAIERPPTYHLIVDVNSAGWRRMALVPGIGEKRARQIIAERDANGPFETLDDLAARIRGIGPATVEKLREWMVARPPVAAPQSQPQTRTRPTQPANH